MKASDSNKKFFLFKLVIGDELIQLEDSSEEGVDNINTTTKSFWFNGKYLKVQIFEEHTKNLEPGEYVSNFGILYAYVYFV